MLDDSIVAMMNTISETIGYLRSLSLPFLSNPYPRELAGRLETARNNLQVIPQGEKCSTQEDEE